MKINQKLKIRCSAIKNKISVDKQRLDEIHCLAENIIDECEHTHNHNDFDNTKISQDYILNEAIKILDIALM